MGIFSKNPSPAMTEIYPSPSLQKFDSVRSSTDVLASIRYISEGIYALKSNNYEPKFKSIDEFDLPAAELLGYLDEVTFFNFEHSILWHGPMIETEIFDRFIKISVSQISGAFGELRGLLEHEPPISIQTVKRFSAIDKKLIFLLDELSRISLEHVQFLATESLVAIHGINLESQDFSAKYIIEMNRSMKFIEDFRKR